MRIGCEASFPARMGGNSSAAQWIMCVLALLLLAGSRFSPGHSPQTSRIWDTQSGETKTELRGHSHVVEVAIFAPVAAYASIRELAGITVSFCSSESKVAALIAAGSQAPPARDEKAKVVGSYVATGSRDKEIKIWDASSGQCLKTLVSTLRNLCGELD